MRVSLRKPASIAIAALTILALATASTFAGTTNSNGESKLDNNGHNNKYGTWHKNDWNCPTNYSETSGWPDYDLNDDGTECVLYAADGAITNIVDNTSH
jgi:hypothetical protein